jgi:hypothetical protein
MSSGTPSLTDGEVVEREARARSISTVRTRRSWMRCGALGRRRRNGFSTIDAATVE